MNARPRILILHASGTNRDHDAAVACELAGGAPEIVHVNQLRAGERRWADYQMLVLPGGFSYGDALGAGRLVALDLNVYFADEVRAFVASGKPVIGICNGFQALVKAGILPGIEAGGEVQQATLARNARGRFECRWVTLIPNPDSPCLFTRGLREPIYCPVAHGEGNFIPRDEAVLAALRARGQIALTYGRQGSGVRGEGAGVGEHFLASDSWSLAPDTRPLTPYPDNPNGSVADIAGICNPQGNVLGLMPHPENHIYPWQHPRWTRGERGGLGLALFEAAIRALASGT
ncbi:MAG: phosphoribosylformylglycinamidine synthase subunit PurQ [Anaerolineae bacterium]|nr:phosphoribosylformylglycinamidine synthase subunit PurQ [Candidatus Roseilinea sp.]MDW8451827.1 phosphoribosylformylglycinamidine synthase subunit PurQ [Anaerolineae bacterium]